MKTEVVNYQLDKQSYNAFVAYPEDQNRPLVLIAHTWAGRDGFVENVYDGSDIGEINVNSIRATLGYDSGEDFSLTWSTEILRSKNGSPYVGAGTLPGEAEYIAPGTEMGPHGGKMYTSYCLPAGTPCKSARPLSISK